MTEQWTLFSPDEAWSALFERGPQAMILIDPLQARVVLANDAAHRLYRFAPGEMSGAGVDEIVAYGDAGARRRMLSPTGSIPFTSGGRHRRSDGSTFHTHVHVVEIAGVTGPLLVATILDESVPDLVDSATGLPDPRLFVDRLEQSIIHAHRDGRALGVCILVVRRLESLIADLSAGQGNRLLHDLGDRLRANLRQSDTVARIGCCEFAIIIEGITDENAIRDVLRKVLDDFAYEFSVADEDLILEPCAGVSIYPHDGHEADMLVENAADAARRAADEGPGVVRFFERP